jgi:signal transduction histidine kinase
MKSIAFQTKARTIDHLGREQIADAPTAISELWKNSFDAYARTAELTIFDQPHPTAVLTDDGHGMSREEFVSRWLVVGTESKATSARVPTADRLGLPLRTKQGQKGIGRLSCANLGSVICVVSKRSEGSFVAAVIDWRLFENAYLNLSDITIPVAEFSTIDEFPDLLQEMGDQLHQNVLGGDNEEIAARRKAAWKASDEEFLSQERSSNTEKHSPSARILAARPSELFFEDHLSAWSVWNGSADHGTAMLIGQVSFDIEAQLETAPDAAAQLAQDRLFETLSSFVDPFKRTIGSELSAPAPEFKYGVKLRTKEGERLVLGSEKEINMSMIESIEHQLIGRIGEDGTFKGQIKAFGNWLEETCIIEPPETLRIPKRSDLRAGPVEVFFSSLELARMNTVHDPQEFTRFQDLAEKYAGLLMFRDGLRVLPFGRPDSDFFEIDLRRSKNAGREFWNHRNLFGRVAISRQDNPNLKDKAGREGLLDNRAAKTLKGLVENVLMVSARRYFGSASDLRSELLPDIQSANKQQKLNEERAKKRKSDRKLFKGRLDRLSKDLPELVTHVANYMEDLSIENEGELIRAQQSLDEFRDRLSDFRLPGVPAKLGSLENKYMDFKQGTAKVQACVADLDAKVQKAIEEIAPASPEEILQQQLSRAASQIHRRVRSWKAAIEGLQRKEFDRVRGLIDTANKRFHAEAEPVVQRLRNGDINLSEASEVLELLRNRIDQENQELFEPYIGALESLSESVDLEQLASFGMDEVAELRTELDRLNSLAQLGIAVEINGHELQSYDEILTSALSKLPSDVLDSKAGRDITFAFEGLTDQLRFLSPLRLSGQRVQSWITGSEVTEYLRGFFGPTLAKHKIEFLPSEEFQKARVLDYQSRIFPVYINLVNNSIYWLSVTETTDPKIVLDVHGGKVFISDNGPGVNEEDQKNLFGLFFTRKLRGGRGVGLYLARANLAAGGHKIEYVSHNSTCPLSGANFAISFVGLNSNET